MQNTNMTQNNFCRLCVTNCQDHRSFFDENGHENEVHQLVVKYFDPKLFSAGQDIKLNVVCLECWRHIFDFHNFQQFVYQSQKKLVQDVYVISEVLQFVPDESKAIENYQNVCIKSEADECLPGSSSEKVNEEKGLQNKQCTSLTLPKLELMDDLSGEDRSSGVGNVSLLFESNRRYENVSVEFDKSNHQFSNFEVAQHAKCKDSENKIVSLIYDETKTSSANSRKLTEASFKNELNSAEDYNSPSELDDFEEHLSSDDESLLTECDGNDSENASESASFKKEIASLSETSAKDTYKRRSAEDLDKFIAQWKAMLECVICNGTFPKLSLLQQHFREEHPQDVFYVLCCGSKLRYACRIEDHIAYHIDPKTYRCELCGRCYKNRLNLMLHTRKDHRSSSIGIKGFEKLDKDIDDIIAKWKNNIRCGICSYTHSSLIVIRQHFQKEHPQEEFHIACCDRKLKKRRRILEHIRYHVNPNIFKCQSCENRFDSRANLIMHMRVASHTLNSGRKRYEKEDKDIDDLLAQWKSCVECALCKDTYSTLTSLRQHFQEKHRQHSFYYVCCQLKLKERGRILEHFRYHIDPNAFKCDICDRRYKYEKNLILHKRSHNCIATNENVRDTVEKLTQNDLDDLILQWKQHLGCIICSTSFPTYTLLQDHFSMEHPAQQFYVTCCERRLERMHDIAEHIRYHIDPNAFKCDVCDRRYKYEKNLTLHKRSHNLIPENESVKSTVKKRTQKDLDDLIPLWKQHLECVICSTSFPTYTLLREHFTAEHSAKKFYVTCCKRKLERVYDIAEHIRYHMNPNAHKCNICEKLYKHAKNLKIHMQRDHPELNRN